MKNFNLSDKKEIQELFFGETKPGSSVTHIGPTGLVSYYNIQKNHICLRGREVSDFDQYHEPGVLNVGPYNETGSDTTLDSIGVTRSSFQRTHVSLNKSDTKKKIVKLTTVIQTMDHGENRHPTS